MGIIDPGLQFIRRFEIRHELGRDKDARTGAGIPGLAGAALLDLEAAEASQMLLMTSLTIMLVSFLLSPVALEISSTRSAFVI